MTTIAVIDDDQTLLELMEEVLSERHWRVLPLTESDSTTDVLRQAQPNAILLDVHLVGKRSGWNVLAKLQEDMDTRAIPVVIWTADARGVDEKREWLDGAGIPVLQKPFEIDDLFECLDTVLARDRDTDLQSIQLSA